MKMATSHPRWIDLRSDTVTIPTQEMLEAMVQAEVGDDVYGDDPTVNLLQEKAAEKMGKEAALFVPSGTFGNQLAIFTHTQSGDEVLIPESNHILEHEVGAPAVISRVGLRPLPDQYGQVDIKDLEKRYREEDLHHPRTGLICMENAHSSGKVVPLSNLQEVYQFAQEKGIPVHLDGARIFNAATFLKVKPAQVALYCDSVMFCVSKGLCAPIGSLLVGTRSFIEKARKNRKLLGGGMRQVGYLAAAGLIALEKMTKRLQEDHENARYLAKRLQEIEGIKVAEDRLDINMVFFTVEIERFSPPEFIQFLEEKNIKINLPREGEFRLVTHYWIKKEDIDYFIETGKTYFSRYYT